MFTGLIFGSIGLGYIVYGRKQTDGVALLAGVGLCVFPYFTDNLWLSILVGGLLVLLPWVVRL